MSPGAVAIPLLAFGAAAALAWGVWAWVGRGWRRRRTHATRGPLAVPPAEGRERSAAASRPDEEPRPASRGGWSLDLTDDP